LLATGAKAVSVQKAFSHYRYETRVHVKTEKRSRALVNFVGGEPGAVLTINKKEGAMSRMRRPRAISIHSLILFALLVAAPGVVFAQSGSVGMPENARAKSYGSGWECGRGYRAVNEACVAVKVPKNAHLDYSGNDWDCNEPYRKRQDRCALP
jgi:hypothetical protein